MKQQNEKLVSGCALKNNRTLYASLLSIEFMQQNTKNFTDKKKGAFKHHHSPPNPPSQDFFHLFLLF